jgi:large subunit ribosomal protein L2
VGLSIGDTVVSGMKDIEPKVGNAMPLTSIPVGTNIHNIELKPGKGGQIARSAGTVARLMAIESNYAHVKMPSGELRLVSVKCRATIGQVGNVEHSLEKSGTAGRTRHFGRKPHVRGMVMNPVDHPLGGGEGKSKSGHHPVSPWGQPAKGYKTRKKVKYSNKWIVTRRKRRAGR